jgi:tRNA modification GTPase
MRLPTPPLTMSDLATTIAAISTPPGKGGVAVIRLSGPEAFEIAARVFRPRGKQMPHERPRTAIYGDFLDGGVPVDDGLATAFPAPASYTGEDTVELSCHGGVLITRTVLEALLAAGATHAAPGEFTRRAYLSGRLGLTEAEAIATLLDAKSTAQVRLSVHIVSLLPLIMVCVLSLISADFQKGLLTGPGMVSISLAAAMDIAALLIIRHLMKGVL